MSIEETNFNSIFSKNLRYYLEANKMTQLELSRLLSVGTTSVYNWCNGVKVPRMDKIDKMCQIFGCKRSDLITDYPSDVKQEEIAEVKEFIKLYKGADPALRQAALAVLKSGQRNP